MPKAIAVALAIVAIGIGGTLSAALARVGELEARELDAEGAPTRAATVRLFEGRLLDGDHVELELCAADTMDPALWAGAGAIALVRTDTAETMFEVPIDARFVQAARRGSLESCVSYGRVRGIELDAPSVPIAIDLRWSATFSVLLRARVLARRPLEDRDLYLVVATLGLALALVALLALRVPIDGHDDARHGIVRAALGVIVVLAAGLVIGLLGSGSMLGLLGGLALAAAEVIAAWVLVRPVRGDRLAALGLERSPRAPEWLVRPLARVKRDAAIEAAAIRLARPFGVLSLSLAPIAGFALFLVARLALVRVPSTGEAPVEAFVSWPSGMLSFAALAVIAPIAEEVFFRGLVFGALRGAGGAGRTLGAIAGSWLLFALFHLPQDWGNWGGLVSVWIAGLGFTLLRAGTRSTLVPCVAHLVYNGLLASSALLAGAG